MLALFAIVMPTDWMAAMNDRLGLGPFVVTGALVAAFANWRPVAGNRDAD